MAAFDRKRLAVLMGGRGLDLLLATTRHNVRYLTGGYCYPLYQWDAHTRGSQYLPFFVIPRDASAPTAFIGRPGEREVLEEAGVPVGRCHESAGIGTLPAAAKTVEVLRGLGLDRGTIGVELPSLPADAWDALREGLPRRDTGRRGARPRCPAGGEVAGRDRPDATCRGPERCSRSRSCWRGVAKEIRPRRSRGQ